MGAFDVLNALNVNEHTEKKNVGGKDLTYLSWCWAWAEVKKKYPDAQYTIWKNADGLPYTVDPNTGYMVYTTVTIEGVTHEMWLPVMDGANKAMKTAPYEYVVRNYTKRCEAATMMDINKTIMRCLVKNLAMFGLGLYLYAGEDVPETEQDSEPENAPQEPQKPFERPSNVEQGNSQVNVQTGKTVPVALPANDPQAYIKNEMKFMMQILGFADWGDMVQWFSEARKGLIARKLIDDVPTKELKMDEAKALIDSIYKNVLKYDTKGGSKS